MDKGTDRTAGPSRLSSTLRPPPLFRSIGPPGLLASLPPHRRLRHIFCRSRGVLPENVLPGEVLDEHTLTDLQAGNHSHAEMRSLESTDTRSEDSILDINRRAGFRSGNSTDAWPLISQCPQTQIKQQYRAVPSHLNASATTNGTNIGKQTGLVTQFKTSEDVANKEKQRQKRRKKSFKVDRAGKQKYVVPSLIEKEDDDRLCEWLQSLGVADGDAKKSVNTNNRYQLFASRCSSMTSHKEPDRVAGRRRDRRPHFLPPIYQEDSLLHVPLLIPENTPPPSRRFYPDAPVHALLVPLQQQVSLKRK